MTLPNRVHLPSLIVSLVALWLGACASGPPVQFFTLAPVAAGASAARTSGNVLVQVAGVHLPPVLDRNAMVHALGADRVAVDDDHRWAAPLNQMIQRVLTQDLAQRLGRRRVVLPGQTAASDTARIHLDVLEFAPDARGSVRFDGSWSLTQGDVVVSSHPLRLDVAARPNDPADQARAMSAAVARIAATIAATLANRETDTPGH